MLFGKRRSSPEGFKQEDYEKRIVCFVCASGDAGRHGAGALVVEVGVGESDGEVGRPFLFFGNFEK